MAFYVHTKHVHHHCYLCLHQDKHQDYFALSIVHHQIQIIWNIAIILLLITVSQLLVLF